MNKSFLSDPAMSHSSSNRANAEVTLQVASGMALQSKHQNNKLKFKS